VALPGCAVLRAFVHSCSAVLTEGCGHQEDTALAEVEPAQTCGVGQCMPDSRQVLVDETCEQFPVCFEVAISSQSSPSVKAVAVAHMPGACAVDEHHHRALHPVEVPALPADDAVAVRRGGPWGAPPCASSRKGRVDLPVPCALCTVVRTRSWRCRHPRTRRAQIPCSYALDDRLVRGATGGSTRSNTRPPTRLHCPLAFDASPSWPLLEPLDG
jgi:hypothetical protein